MDFFQQWLLDVANDFLDLQALLEPALLQYVVTVGRREPLAFAIYFMLLVQRVHRLSTLFNQLNYNLILEEIFQMHRAALARRLPAPSSSSSSSSSSPPYIPPPSSSTSSPPPSWSQPPTPLSPTLSTLSTSPPHSPLPPLPPLPPQSSSPR